MGKRSTLIVLLFIAVMLFNSIKSGFMISFYLVDNSSFTELFCVNQDKPELECNGKCELSKMNEGSTADEKPSYLDFLQRQVVLFFNPLQNLEIFEFSEDRFISIDYSNNYNYHHIPRITHPPSLQA